MLKIIIPLAGSSELFEKAGYPYPKPLIEIKGKPMIQWVAESVKEMPHPYQFIFIIKESDAQKFHLDNTLKLIDNNAEIIKIKNETKGGLCSVLMAADKIADDDALLILNSDQIIDKNLLEFDQIWKENKSDVGLVTFPSIHPRWSYILAEGDRVIQTAEKNPISQNAIAGYYYFSSARDFLKYSFQTIINDANVNGLYFISSVINEYILDNKKVHYHPITKEDYHSLYTPKLVGEFENLFDNGK